jgi:hypothetical protein
MYCHAVQSTVRGIPFDSKSVRDPSPEAILILERALNRTAWRGYAQYWPSIVARRLLDRLRLGGARDYIASSFVTSDRAGLAITRALRAFRCYAEWDMAGAERWCELSDGKVRRLVEDEWLLHQLAGDE